MIKTYQTTRTALAAALVLFVGATAVSAEAEFSLRLGSYAPEGDIIDRSLEKFKENVEANSNGRVEITIFRNGTLGSNREVLEMAKVGAADFVVAGAPHVSSYAPVLGSVSFPFIWKDRKTMLEVLDGDLGERLAKVAEAQADGLKILAWWDTGVRSVSNNVRPIVNPEDIKGLKLRTVPAPVQVAFWRKLGAIPTPMGWSEVMPSLQQGVIDGQENPPAVMYPYKVYEVQKYYSLTAHSNEPTLLVMSKATFDKLPGDLQAVVTGAADAVTPFEREIAVEYNTNIMVDLGKVMEINEVPEATRAHFRKVAASIYGEAYKDIGEEGQAIVEEIIKRTH